MSSDFVAMCAFILFLHHNPQLVVCDLCITSASHTQYLKLHFMLLKTDTKIRACMHYVNLSDIPVDYNTVYNYQDYLNSMYFSNKQAGYMKRFL